jgi:hypothetical protein
MSFVSQSAVHTNLLLSELHLRISVSRARYSRSTPTLSPIIEQVCLRSTTLHNRLPDRTFQLGGVEPLPYFPFDIERNATSFLAEDRGGEITVCGYTLIYIHFESAQHDRNQAFVCMLEIALDNNPRQGLLTHLCWSHR